MLGLDSQVQKWEQAARLIEENVEIVDQCINAIRVSLSQKIGWSQLNDYIKEDRNNGNPLAMMIHKLKLEENHVTILLYPKFVDEEEQTSAAETVDIDIGLSAHANAANYFSKRKKADEKKGKTIFAADQAYKSAEKRAKRDMKDMKVKSSLKQIRKPFWFEKFFWFISSDNYIVIAGREIRQNEIIYKRYLERTDLYFHADLHGASSVVVKNPSGGEVPPLTITQAQVFATSHSNAWRDKTVAPAYWVHANQVSKTAPSGEYISTGSFMIRGKKNLLPQCSLVMGLGILFCLSEYSILAHADDRKPKFFDDRDQDTSKENSNIQGGKVVNPPNSSINEENPDHQPQALAEEENSLDKENPEENQEDEENQEGEENQEDEDNQEVEDKTEDVENVEEEDEDNPEGEENAEDVENPEEDEEKPAEDEENLENEGDDEEEENPALENQQNTDEVNQNQKEKEGGSDSEGSLGEIDQDLVNFSVKLVREQPNVTSTKTTEQTTEQTTKKISAYERRQMKKQKQRGDKSPVLVKPEDKQSKESQKTAENEKTEKPPAKQIPIQYKKGQKAKLKK